MRTKLTSLVTAHYILLARSFVIILGCIAVWWGIVGFPVFWRESSTERIADRIIAGEPYKVEILARQLPIIESIETSAYCRPAGLRSAAVIQLRMVEASGSAKGGKPRDEHLELLGNLIRSTLSCSPADPFLWLVLYWVESTQNGSGPDSLKYLRISYQLGQNEGWIGLKRNRFSFSAFEQLPADLAESALSEFVGLVKCGFTQQAAEIFIGPAWRERELILSRLGRIPDQDRQLFADALYRQGYDGNVPGVARPEFPLRR